MLPFDNYTTTGAGSDVNNIVYLTKLLQHYVDNHENSTTYSNLNNVMLASTNQQQNGLELHDESDDVNETLLLNDFFDMNQNNNDCDDSNLITDEQLLMTIQSNHHMDIGFTSNDNVAIDETTTPCKSNPSPVGLLLSNDNFQTSFNQQGYSGSNFLPSFFSATSPTFMLPSNQTYNSSRTRWENKRQQQENVTLVGDSYQQQQHQQQHQQQQQSQLPFLIPSTISMLQDKPWNNDDDEVKKDNTSSVVPCSCRQYTGDNQQKMFRGTTSPTTGLLLNGATREMNSMFPYYPPIVDTKEQTNQTRQQVPSQVDIGTDSNDVTNQHAIIYQQMIQALMMQNQSQHQQNHSQQQHQSDQVPQCIVSANNNPPARQDTEQIMYCNQNHTIGNVHPPVCESQTQVILLPTSANNNNNSVIADPNDLTSSYFLEMAQNLMQQQMLTAAITFQNCSNNTGYSNSLNNIPVGPTSGGVFGVNNPSSALLGDSSFGGTSYSHQKAPLKSLSAYNFFFRDERERIISGESNISECNDNEINIDSSMEHQNSLLKQHWNQDRNKKKHRRHRKTHGKISFTTLSKVISRRWKNLSENKKTFYRTVASKDWERYQNEINDNRIASFNATLFSSSSMNQQQPEIVTPISGTPTLSTQSSSTNMNNLVYLPFAPSTFSGDNEMKTNGVFMQSHATVLG